MKIVKGILFVLIALVGIYVIMCFVGPSTLNVSRSINVSGTPEQAYTIGADYREFKNWSPWNKRDTAMTITYTGEPGTVGHGMAWKSETQGNGSQKILELTPNEFIKSELLFEGFEDPNMVTMSFKAMGDSTTITWTMDGGNVPFMFRGMMLAMGGAKMIEADYDEGLKGLKTLIEAMPKAESVKIEEIEIPEMFFVGKVVNTNQATIDSTLFANAYSELGEYIGGMQNMAGAPFCIGRKIDFQSGDMTLEISLPTATAMPATDKITTGVVPAGKALKVVHMGPYDTVDKSWMAFSAQTEGKYKFRFDGYEVYMNDPTTVSSPDQIITWLIMPIE